MLKKSAFAFLAAFVASLSVTSAVAATPRTLRQAEKPCSDCGKLNELCSGSVI